MPLSYPTAVVAVAILAFLTLLALLIVKRMRRDRAEATQRYRLTTLRGLVLDATEKGGAVAALRELTAAPPAELVRMDQVLRQLDGEQLEAVRSVAGLYVGRGLAGRLVRETTESSPSRRAIGALLLGRLKLDGAAEAITPLIDDRDPDVAQAACRALGILGEPDGPPALVAAIGRVQVATERIVEALITPAFTHILARMLSEGLPADVRPHVARALGLIGDPEGETALLAAATDADVELQIAISRALGTAGTDRSIPYLLAMLRHDEWPVRAQAATSLGSMTPTDDVVRGLEGVLSDPAWWVRANAASSLGRLGGVGIAGLLRATRHADRYARARAEETLALIAIRGAKAVT